MSYNNVTFDDNEKVIFYIPASIGTVKSLKEKLAEFTKPKNTSDKSNV